MKSHSWIFIFLSVIGLETKSTSAYTYIQINDVTIELNGESIQSKESFQREYGKDLLAIGSLQSDRVANMKPHLVAITKTLQDNSLGTYFEYLLALCNDYIKLRKLDAVTKNIYNFVAESGGTSKNSFVSFGGVMFSGNSLSPTTNGKIFSANSIRTDNENEIKSYFEQNEKAMKKAAEEQKKMLARAAKIREEMLKAAERQRQETFEWAEKLRQGIMGNLEKDMTKLLGMGGNGGMGYMGEMSDIGGMDDMVWMGGKDGMKMARELAKKRKKRETIQKRNVEKEPKHSKNEFAEAPIKKKKKLNRSLNNREKIQKQETFPITDTMNRRTAEDLEDSAGEDDEIMS